MDAIAQNKAYFSRIQVCASGIARKCQSRQLWKSASVMKERVEVGKFESRLMWKGSNVKVRGSHSQSVCLRVTTVARVYVMIGFFKIL